MEKMEINQERRQFLRVAPVAAAAGWLLADASLFATPAAAQMAPMTEGGQFEVISGREIEEDAKIVRANPGNKTLYQGSNLAIVMTSEAAKSGAEFEWHESRDHIFRILDGATTYELGGTPQNAHSPRPGEWLAPASNGATTVELRAGDVLVVRRGTPHKRTTKERVTLVLISPQSA
jgi:mannose-6-phosphate isomerase-like protein (cupin superfamily)